MDLTAGQFIIALILVGGFITVLIDMVRHPDRY